MKKFIVLVLLLTLLGCTPKGTKYEMHIDFDVPTDDIAKKSQLEDLNSIPGVLDYKILESDTIRGDYKIISMIVYVDDSHSAEEFGFIIAAHLLSIWDDDLIMRGASYLEL